MTPGRGGGGVIPTPVYDPNQVLLMKYQFLTLIATVLLVGATIIGVNLTIVDARFEQVDAGPPRPTPGRAEAPT